MPERARLSGSSHRRLPPRSLRSSRAAHGDGSGTRGRAGSRRRSACTDAPCERLILDELGYLALPDGAAELVFQVISERHERASLIITTNLPFGEWGRVFPDPRLAKAVVDRVTHRAHIIDCGTQSWRFTHGLKTPRGARPRGPARLPRDPTDRSSDTPARETL